MKTKLILACLLFTTPARAQDEVAEIDEELLLSIADVPPPRVLAAEGPGEGHGALALGLAMLGPIPTVDLRYVRGLGKRLGFDAELATIGVRQRLRAGARYLLLDQDEHAIAFRFSFMEAHSLPDEVVIAGAGPGLLYSFGSEDVRLTLALDVGGSIDGGVQVEPSIGVELPLDDELQLYLEASVFSALGGDEDVIAVPVFSGGVAW